MHKQHRLAIGRAEVGGGDLAAGEMEDPGGAEQPFAVRASGLVGLGEGDERARFGQEARQFGQSLLAGPGKYFPRLVADGVCAEAERFGRMGLGRAFGQQMAQAHLCGRRAQGSS